MLFFFKKNLFSKKDFASIIEEINSFEPNLEKLTNDELKNKSKELQNKIEQGEKLDNILPESFALVRESSKRNLNQRHFDVQLIGGIVMHQGKIAEMLTGEGKTLAATAPAYLNALTGKGVHVITVNDYLARRDAVWMGQIYYALGLSVGCLTHESAYLYDPKYISPKENEELNEKDKERDILGSFKIVQDFLRPVERKEAYLADITYGTNHEFGFDYLRDNLAHQIESRVQRNFNFVIIDEVDSILIDEARTPLIIAAPDAQSSDYYKVFAKIANQLSKEEDYVVDEKMKSVTITDKGIDKVENLLKLKDFYAPENLRLVHYLESSLKAKALFHRDKQYVVNGGEIIIVDEFTGRLMQGRRYSAGLHQAIEAKENVEVKQETRTFAQITIQNYFRLYEKIAGMTGTAQTSAEEFHKVYNLEVVSVPPNKPMTRIDKSDLIYKTTEAKYQAIIEKIRERHINGQPVLLGTTSITNNEKMDSLLKQAGIPHEVLNAKNHEREGSIIAQAGRAGAVIVATNMAGRGVDIILGGNPFSEEEAEKIKALGGLYVIGTERHEARRIDNQLRGRSGRQGDPGSTQFFLSLEDDLLRIFGGQKIKSLMEKFNLPEDQPIESSIVSKAVNEAQKKVEGFNFDLRKHLLEYDDVLNKQRTAFYKKREEIIKEENSDDKINKDNEQNIKAIKLNMLDVLWMNHLENIEALRDAVGMRAYGQHDPLVEYRRESYGLFKEMIATFEKWLEENEKKIMGIIKSENTQNQQIKTANINNQTVSELGNFKKVGRNDLCPCGSGKKYKKCCGK
ncbi:preprotein translocase subunit SecA [Candidatus Wolfebacteria bacterium]|nr:preprotein translocase subunit SecA [Candidatus Wolfebacteria bacterium]